MPCQPDRQENYSYLEVPEGSVLYDIERGNFNKERNADPHTKLPYCNAQQSTYEYTPKPPVRNDTAKPDGWYWNDNKLACKQLNFAEVVKKTPDAAYITTYQKETLSTVYDCNAPPYSSIPTTVDHPYGDCRNPLVRDVADDAQSTVLLNPMGRNPDGSPREQYTFRTEESPGTYTCTCLELRNYLVVTPEHVRVRFHHSFQATSEKIGFGVAGSTTQRKDDSWMSPRTKVYWKNDMDNKLDEHEPGSSLSYTIKELLNFTTRKGDGECDDDESDCGDLDSRISTTLADVAEGTEPPKRRVSGVILNMELVYDVDASLEESSAKLIISVTDTITSWNLDPQMHERQVFDHTTGKYTRKYSELLNRGIVVKFSAKGRVLKFNWQVLYFNIISLLVLLPLVNTGVIFIAK